MARVGPNQDINDPTTILEVAFEYQQESNLIGDMLAKSIQVDPNATGPPIIDVFIPFKKTDGSTELLQGSDIEIDPNGGFIFDEDLVFNSNILTYISLAERFRANFITLRDALLGISDVEDTDITNVDPTTESTTIGFRTEDFGSKGGKIFTIDEIIFNKNIPDIPIFSGSGPTSYNFGTYPQLLDLIESMTVNAFGTQEVIEEIYHFGELTGADEQFPAGPFFTQVETGASYNGIEDEFFLDFQKLFPEIQIPNLSSSDKTINISATADYIRALTGTVFFTTIDERAQVFLRHRIADFNSNDFSNVVIVQEIDEFNPFPGIALSGTLNLSASLDENIIIPPNKSLFFTVFAKSRTLLQRLVGTLETMTITQDCLVHVDGGSIVVPDIEKQTIFVDLPG